MRILGAIAVLLAFILGGQLSAAENALPRVLILGDEIYQQPASDLNKELKEKAEIHYPRLEPGVVWNSATALELLNQQLGEGRWDLIHFNCGLGDLIHRVPGVKSFRVMPRPAGGIRTAKQALHYLVMVKETLGDDWLTPRLFRFGASSLTNDLLRQLLKGLTGHYMAMHDFSEA